jgi:tetratricopeptide (TPR) repeat protein/transcriptional regulator with XRE-family HTH domain
MDADDFGPALRNARTQRGLSLTGLSRLVHYSRGYLSKVETGKAHPNESLADRCDRALGAEGQLSQLVATPFPRASRTLERPSGLIARPFDLPGMPMHFSGREAELATLLRLLTPRRQRRDVPIVLLHGLGGVGKTALAVAAGHRLRESFPDGCLFMALYGYAVDRPAVPTAEALDSMLRRLGIPGRAIPARPDERAALYRSVLQQRRMLIMIDDARRADQLRPLLPASAGCAVIVTSRRRLLALDDAEPIRLDPLPVNDAAWLFRAVAGIEGTGDDTDRRITEVIRSCGLLPLTVRIAAAAQHGGDAADLADLARRLADHRSRLGQLDDGERSATAVLAASCAELPDDSRRLLALLPLAPGGLTEVTAAWPTDVDPAACGRQLRTLAEHNLLLPSGGSSYRMHDLVRAYAAEVLLAELPETERVAALRRVVTGYLTTASAADQLITPHRYRPPLEPHASIAPAMAFPHDRAAAEWLATEQDALVTVARTALDRGWYRVCWQLAYLLRGYFFLVKAWDTWLETQRLALAAAERDGDPWALAVTRNNLGLVLIEQGRISAAQKQYTAALAILRRLGDVPGEAATLGHLAWAAYCTGDVASAVRRGRRALRLYESQDDRRGVGITLRTVAMAESRLGRHDAAERDLHRALDLFIELELPLDATMALTNLGALAAVRGDLPGAVRHFGHAVEGASSCGSEYEQARAYDGLAAAAAAAGRPRAATRFAARAQALYEVVHVPAAERVRIAPVRPATPSCPGAGCP